MHILDVITYTYGLKPFGIEKILQLIRLFGKITI